MTIPHPGKLLKTIFGSDILLPIILLLTYIVFMVIARGYIPTSEELVSSFAGLYAKYGYEIIFVAAFLEALVLVNFIVPGQMAMAMGVIFARTGQTNLFIVILVASLGAFCGYLLDYIMGYFGFSEVIKKFGYGNLLQQAKMKLKQYGKRAAIIGFIHPNIASFFSLLSGTSNINAPSFVLIALVATFFWASIWGLLIYLLGNIVLTIFSKYAYWLVLIGISGFILLKVWNRSVRRRKT